MTAKTKTKKNHLAGWFLYFLDNVLELIMPTDNLQRKPSSIPNVEASL